CARDQSGFDFW
nr:immunoglobulin heavy chain junction region [Macaca mulatta]MOW77560.1 immunoglobulin heavy chain junction region [Macaca mulatta]MOW78577.1 immunoglobulin heavy chain junction region [Macaca mulatta]MOW81217.1 immunoglobulin heavy chain junction region [Macaca mulatta]MOW84123.1 immunoglobulin heavy chain junction region [Macaca mulatta]